MVWDADRTWLPWRDAALSGSLHTSVSKETEVALSVGSDMSVALGANYKIDGDSNVKGKVDKEVLSRLFLVGGRGPSGCPCRQAGHGRGGGGERFNQKS